MAGASKFGGTENGADCSKCGGTVAVLFKTRNGTSLVTSESTKVFGISWTGTPRRAGHSKMDVDGWLVRRSRRDAEN